MNRKSESVYLRSCLEPLAPFLEQPDVTDLYINRSGEVWIESIGGLPIRHVVPELTGEVLYRLARQVAALSSQGINREHPLLAANLPGGERIQIVIPPATRGDIAIAIRKHIISDISLEAYGDGGAFDRTGSPLQSRKPDQAQINNADGYVQFLRSAVLDRRNILISGGTSSGKTTFLNALLSEVPADERLIFIEDTPELRIKHDNAIGLVAARGALGEADVSTDDLLIGSLRLRPDRIVLGELRGSEAVTFLRAVNTGHPGSFTTIHADSAERAIDQLALLVLQTGARLTWDDVVRYVRRSIDIVVQLAREEGRRLVKEVVALRV